nr:hypothetical protein [Tanacetum cinerariifolium]
MEIVPEDDDDVTIKATPLSSKFPTIVDYEIYKEVKKIYFKIIKADRNSQNYLTFRTIFKNFNKEDLEVLRSIMKERFKKAKPVNDMDNLLLTMFEHHVEDNIWKYQQGAVKMYPFTNNILHQLWKYVRLHVDYEVEMAYDLLRNLKIQKVNIKFRGGLLGLKDFMELLLLSSRVTIVDRVSTAKWIKTEIA